MRSDDEKRIIIILLCIILFILIGVSFCLKALVNDVKSITVSNPDIANIADGIYVREYSVTPVYVVSVKYSCGFSNLLNPSIIVNEI